MRPETKCIHSGGYFDEGTRGVNTPIFTSSAYEYLDTDARPYPRYFNTPNQEAVVSKLCDLESTEDGILFSSGMAAISTALLSFLKSGDYLVIQDEVYGGSHAFVSNHFAQHGIDYTFASAHAKAIIGAMRPETKVIYIESPTNPLLTVIDIAKIAEFAKTQNIITMIDNTFATPIHQNPFRLGIDIVIHSGTKYLGGHSDLCCGVILTTKKLANQIRNTALSLGGSLDALSCYMLERSLKTLCLRVERQTDNAMKMAIYLANQPTISRVNYPGLENHQGHQIAKVQMKRFGAMLSFELQAGYLTASEFMRRLKLIRPALSLGGLETTICDPATTSHQKVSPEVRQRMGITENLLRLSVGVEHIDDLIEDVEQALPKN